MPPLTIVIVDDVPDFRQIVRAILADLPGVVTVVGEAADGEEAFTVVLRERPDIVITDLMMPRLNGAELTRRIRQELPQTKIILMSSSPTAARSRLEEPRTTVWTSRIYSMSRRRGCQGFGKRARQAAGRPPTYASGRPPARPHTFVSSPD